MVTLKGPMYSHEARGKLADVLTFQTHAGRSTAKAHAAPRQPRTGAQVGVRAMMKFLSQWWKILSPAEQATWSSIATGPNVAPYHAYIKENMLRWKTFRAPSKQYPATELLIPQVGNHIQVQDAVASIRCGLRINMAFADVASIVFRGTATGFPIDVAHVVMIVPRDYTVTWTWARDTPLAPGDYWYNSTTFMADGAMGLTGTYRKATAT